MISITSQNHFHLKTIYQIQLTKIEKGSHIHPKACLDRTKMNIIFLLFIFQVKVAIFSKALKLGNFLVWSSGPGERYRAIYVHLTAEFAISYTSQYCCLKKFKPIVMDSSIFSASSKLPFFHAFFLFFISFFFYLNMISGTETQFSYRHHCDSVVHESKPAEEEFNIIPFADRYYSGGDKFLNPSSNQYYPPVSKVLVFETHHVYTTDVEDVFKVKGNLIFQSSYYYERSFSHGWSFYSHSSDSGALDFDFQGFWSRTTGKLCMVGSSYTYSKEGKLLHLAAVLKLNNLKNSSTINTLVTGTMDSLYPADEPNYFDQISLLMFPQVNYNYTMVSKQFSQGCPGATDVPEDLSLSLSLTTTICDIILAGGNAFELEYASGCDSSKSCGPFGNGIGYLPQVMSLRMIQCSDQDMKLKLRFLIEFPNSSYRGYYSSFNFSTSLVGEGSWDAKKNQLCIVACRIYDASSSLEKSHVGDCTTRLSLRFPAVLSIRNTSTVVGEIWSEKHRNESGFFDRIVIRKTDHSSGGIQLQGLKYEYMKTNKVSKLCPKKKTTRNSGEQYPDGYSGDMGFSMSIIKGSKGGIGWGSSNPLAVGDQPYQRFPFLRPSSSSRPKNDNGSLLNISYTMSITLSSFKLDTGLNPFNQSLNGYLEIQISAEGVYDAETGNLCMVGCRDLRAENKASLKHSVDCDILVNIHFPPLNSDRKGSKIGGSIKSMRQNTDHFHFGPLPFTGRAYYGRWAMESIWRMDVEIIMSVISNTLAIVFIVLQIIHGRKHPGVCPFISFLMLVILALGHLIPLVLNLEAMFDQDSERSVWFRGGTWLEMNEVIIRVVTMVAFLLHIRLLMFSWTARCSNEKKKALWIAEKRGLYVCFPVYISGGLIAFFLKWRKNLVDTGRYSPYDREQIFLVGSRAYAGLILDAFLFPQILFNIFQNSREQALSRFFYIGITLVRLVPHGYDLYRAHNYVDVDDSYIYADPSADYYSTAWDFIIPVLGLFFAAIIYLQQRFGGRCVLPKRFQESVAYEELPVASEEEFPLKSST
ncbi:uncharacterized protein LOC111276226 [Durio zibethinus]|uniref:RING-type E3 ubiquitin transferase n=1 Tax=Durio zibethinus TaxID=66656 RepID=A0A6P5WPT1_DURZI|nr:uncharacterized protein LOC111276226 [Durio zibethinus]